MEDDQNIREIESFALKNSGYTIMDFECAKDFYHQLAEKVPDCILLDIMLPDEDGLEKDFYVDEIYEVDGRLYAAVIPADVENVTEYYVFRLIDLGNDDFEMEDIEEEAEYDAAADAYEEILDTRMWNREFEGE